MKGRGANLWGVLALLSLFGGCYVALHYVGWPGALAGVVLAMFFGWLEYRARAEP
jgi:hypothetical protein